VKVFCFVFTIHILLLSLVPCEELTTKAEIRVNEAFQQSQIQSHEQTSDENENCSPFCICSCCHFSTAYQFKIFSVTDKITITPISTPEISYQNPHTQNYKNSIWQPPKFNS
jgi:hypothetical protein